MREGIIYLITNKVNGKKYVGQTVQTLNRRWKNGHLRDAHAGSELILHRAIRKHGIESFTIEVIAESLEPFLDDLEIFFIKLYNTFSRYGYNMTTGGDGRKGHVTSAETKAKMSLAQKGRQLSPEHKAKLSASNVGRPAYNKGIPTAEETKEKISRANTGKKRSEKAKANMSLARTGTRQSPETVANRVAKITGKKRSAKAKARMSLAHKGKKLSDETRAKMSASKLWRWAAVRAAKTAA